VYDGARLSARRSLSRRKIDYAIFEIDQESPIEHEEEFIDVLCVRASDIRPERPPSSRLNRSPCKASGCTICRCKHPRASAHQSIRAARAECSGTFCMEILQRVFSLLISLNLTRSLLLQIQFPAVPASCFIFAVEIIGLLTLITTAIGG
jgi:hypothetical protein